MPEHLDSIRFVLFDGPFGRLPRGAHPATVVCRTVLIIRGIQLELEFEARVDSDPDIDLWSDLGDDVDLELELSDDDLLSASELTQAENFGASYISDEDGSKAQEVGAESSEDENDAQYVYRAFQKYA